MLVRTGSPSFRVEARGSASFQVAEVGQPLLDDRLLLGGVLELGPVRAVDGGAGGVDAGWRTEARRAPGEGLALDVGGDRQAEERRGSSGRCRAGSAARVRPGGDPGPGEGDDPLGPVRAGQVRVGLDPGLARGELGPDPVRLVGQGDQVGVAFAGRVDPVGLGRRDDLREEGRPGLGMAGLGQGLARRRRGPRRSAGGSPAGPRRRRSVEFR